MSGQSAGSRPLTVPEAAAALGIGQRQCYEAVRTGGIPAVRIGSRWLIPADFMQRLGLAP